MEPDRGQLKHEGTRQAGKPCGTAWQGREPRLSEALADPVVRSMMRADHVDPGELERSLRRLARKLGGA